MNMQPKCIVQNCNSIYNLHRFPSLKTRNPCILELNKERVKKWKECLGIEDTDTSDQNIYICGDHFLSGKPASLHDGQNIDWIPTLNLGHITSDASIVNDSIENIEKHYVPRGIEFVKMEIEDEDMPILNEPIFDEDIEFIEVTENEIIQELKEEDLCDEFVEETVQEIPPQLARKIINLDLGEHTCRMCLKNDATKPKSSVFHLINKNYKLSDLILCVLNISFYPGEPYLNVCEDCVDKIQTMFKWYNFFLDNNLKIKTFLRVPKKKRLRPKKDKNVPFVESFEKSIPIIEVSMPEAIKDMQNYQADPPVSSDLSKQIELSNQLEELMVEYETSSNEVTNCSKNPLAIDENFQKTLNKDESLTIPTPGSTYKILKPVFRTYKNKGHPIKIIQKIPERVTNLSESETITNSDPSIKPQQKVPVQIVHNQIIRPNILRKQVPLVVVKGKLPAQQQTDSTVSSIQPPQCLNIEKTSSPSSKVAVTSQNIEKVDIQPAVTEPLEATNSANISLSQPTETDSLKATNIENSNLSQETSKSTTLTNIPEIPILTPIRVKKGLKRKIVADASNSPVPSKIKKFIKIPKNIMESSEKFVLKMEANGKLVKIPLKISPNKTRQVVLIKQKNFGNGETPKILGFESLGDKDSSQKIKVRFINKNEAAKIVSMEHDYVKTATKKNKTKVKRVKKKIPKPPKIRKPYTRKMPLKPKDVKVYSDPPLKCFICMLVLESQEIFDDHIRVHGENPPYHCNICNMVSGNVEKWNAHNKVHDKERPYKCKLCPDRYYTSSIRLKYHVKNKHVKPNYPKTMYVCCYCARTFVCQRRLKEHEAFHNGQNIRERKHKCRFCDKKFLEIQQKDRHEFTHSHFKPHKCEDCGKYFKTSYTKSLHRELHAIEKTIPCDFCKKMFAYEVSKRRHTKDIHIRPTNKLLIVGSNGDFCTSSAGRPINLKGTNILSKRNSNIMCPICNEVYRTNRELMQHIDSTHPDNDLIFFGCPEMDCDAKFLSRNSATLHKHYKHSTFKCRYCSETFLSTGKRESHENSHKDKVECPVEGCGKKFTSSGYLRVHLKFTHSNTRNYSCSFCDKKFKKSCERQLHERTHTGEKPYVCSTCGKAFSDGSTLLKHNKVHENKDKTRKIQDDEESEISEMYDNEIEEVENEMEENENEMEEVENEMEDDENEMEENENEIKDLL